MAGKGKLVIFGFYVVVSLNQCKIGPRCNSISDVVISVPVAATFLFGFVNFVFALNVFRKLLLRNNVIRMIRFKQQYNRKTEPWLFKRADMRGYTFSRQNSETQDISVTKRSQHLKIV